MDRGYAGINATIKEKVANTGISEELFNEKLGALPDRILDEIESVLVESIFMAISLKTNDDGSYSYSIRENLVPGYVPSKHQLEIPTLLWENEQLSLDQFLEQVNERIDG